MIEKPIKKKFRATSIGINGENFIQGYNQACEDWEKWIKERLLTETEIKEVLGTFDSFNLTTYSGTKRIAQVIYEAQAKKMEGK